METASGLVVFKRCCGRNMFLLLKASYGIMHWSPPKGHKENGEELLETAFRETKEECGISKEDLTLLDFTHTCQYISNGNQKMVFYWLAQLVNKDTPIVLSHEHIDYKWLTISDAITLCNFQQTEELLTKANDYINKISPL